MTDHIKIYEHGLDTGTCRDLITKFEASDLRTTGSTGAGENKKHKDSIDLALNMSPGWEPQLQMITQNLVDHLVSYLREYSYLLFSHMGRHVIHPDTGQPVELTHDTLQGSDTLVREIVKHVFRPSVFVIQKYNKGSGGYHSWHSEIFPNDPHAETLHRVLFFIYYLNDIADGGETEFYYQQRQIEPKEGRLIISPGGFTHTHKGHIPQSDDKYILTSWVLFQRYEEMVKRRESNPNN